MEEVTALDFLSVLWLGAMTVVALTIPALFLWSAWVERKPKKLAVVSLSGLPEKDPNRSNQEQGLYQKFNVRRRDGSDTIGGKHEGCDYFVLDLTHDAFALETVWYYALACKAKYPLLSKDLVDRVNAAYERMEAKGDI